MRPRYAGSRHFLHLALAVLSLLFAVLPTRSLAEPDNTREYRLKAAFVYNFTKFIRWPETASAGSDENVVLCVLAEESIDQIVRSTVEGKPVRGNPVTVRTLAAGSTAETCHLVFVSQSRRKHIKTLDRRAKESGLLIVSEAKAFGQGQAMINLVVEENKVRFEINMGATDGAGLRISSKLLKLALIVGEADDASEARVHPVEHD
ncbi:MAG: YfiR family protein [bacterium]|nr:YfiR family protein [bacterium]